MFRAQRWRENLFVFWHTKVKLIGVHTMHSIIVLMPWLYGLKKLKEESCADHILVFILLWIFSKTTWSLSVSFILTMWKDDNLSISLNEERKACPLTTESSFVHFRRTLLKLKFMADPGLWFATNSWSLFTCKTVVFSRYQYKPDLICTWRRLFQIG